MSPAKTHDLADRARTEVAVPLGSATRCARSLRGRLRGHRHTRLALRNLMANECSTVGGCGGTVMRHFVSAGPLAAPEPVASLALGMAVPAASRMLIPAPRRAQRLTPSEAAATRRAVALAPVTARADEHLALTPSTQEQPGIVHRSPRRGGLDDPRSPGNTALGAVRQCGSGRSLGRDRQVNTVRGCVGLLAACDLTPIPERRHRMGARTRPLLSGHIGSGGTHRPIRGGGAGTIQSRFAPTLQIRFTRAVRRIATPLRRRQ